MAKGGKTLNDRVLAAAVRQLGLRRIKKEFEENPESDFSKQLLLKLAPTLLPRLNEHTGEDGERLTISFDPVFKKNAIARETTEVSGEPSAI